MGSLFRRPVRHVNPFRVARLPLIARLYSLGFHRFRKRWTKRLFKRPARLLFDVAYHRLKLQGEGRMTVAFPDGPRGFGFDGRSAQFAGVYMLPEHMVFEPGVAALLDTYMTGGRVFFDVGANWGYLSLYAATLPGYAGPIHAFEPVPSAHRDLVRAVDELGLGARIVCHEMALSDRTGEGRMIIPDAVNTGWAKVVEASVVETGCFPVRTVRLDDLTLPDPDFIKIDAEGHERRILEGATAVLRRARPHVILENWLEHRDLPATLAPLKLLEREGYRLFVPCWQTPGDPPVVWPEPHPPSPAPDQVFVLVPTTPEQRLFMTEHLSLYACPAERMNELRERFEVVP